MRAVSPCLGASSVQLTSKDRQGLDGTYWVSAWTAQLAAQAYAKDPQTGRRIVFVSSLLALASFVGYSAYAPGKYALRGRLLFRACAFDITDIRSAGLADTLRSEMLLYGVKVHLYCPATITSPHLAIENATKPDITKKIEEGDAGLSPEACVPHLLGGMSGRPHLAISG